MSQQQERLRNEADSVGVQEAAAGIAQKHIVENKHNPEFAETLREAGVDSSKFPYLSAELGPLLADAYVVGQRSEEFEREAKWANYAEQERIIEEKNAGRLCQGNVQRFMRGLHKREDKDLQDFAPRTEDEKRAIRDAVQAATIFQSMSIDGAGRKSLTEPMTVKRDESDESDSRMSKASSLLG